MGTARTKTVNVKKSVQPVTARLTENVKSFVQFQPVVVELTKNAKLKKAEMAAMLQFVFANLAISKNGILTDLTNVFQTAIATNASHSYENNKRWARDSPVQPYFAVEPGKTEPFSPIFLVKQSKKRNLKKILLYTNKKIFHQKFRPKI